MTGSQGEGEAALPAVPVRTIERSNGGSPPAALASLTLHCAAPWLRGLLLAYAARLDRSGKRIIKKRRTDTGTSRGTAPTDMTTLLQSLALMVALTLTPGTRVCVIMGG